MSAWHNRVELERFFAHRQKDVAFFLPPPILSRSGCGGGNGRGFLRAAFFFSSSFFFSAAAGYSGLALRPALDRCHVLCQPFLFSLPLICLLAPVRRYVRCHDPGSDGKEIVIVGERVFFFFFFFSFLSPFSVVHTTSNNRETPCALTLINIESTEGTVGHFSPFSLPFPFRDRFANMTGRPTEEESERKILDFRDVFLFFSFSFQERIGWKYENRL